MKTMLKSTLDILGAGQVLPIITVVLVYMLIVVLSKYITVSRYLTIRIPIPIVGWKRAPDPAIE